MDNLSIQRIGTLHPNLREKARKDYEGANSLLGKGLRLRITQAFRTFAEQDALYAQGRTKPGAKVTNAKGGQSSHNYGLAIDIALLYDKNGDGIFEEVSWDLKRDGDKDGVADWLEVTKYLTERGWVNGFWTNGKHWDKPHFQYDYGMSIIILKSKYDKKDFIAGTNYVKI